MTFRRQVLGLTDENSIDNLGPVKWDIALCLLAVFTIVYFAMWKGVKSSGKVRYHKFIVSQIAHNFETTSIQRCKELNRRRFNALCPLGI